MMVNWFYYENGCSTIKKTRTDKSEVALQPTDLTHAHAVNSVHTLDTSRRELGGQLCSSKTLDKNMNPI